MDVHLALGPAPSDQSVWRRRPGGESALPFGLALLLLSDPPTGARQIPLLHALQETKQGVSMSQCRSRVRFYEVA